MQGATFKYPRPAVGQIFAVSALVFAAAALVLGSSHPFATSTFKALGAVYLLVAGVYYFMSVYRLHEILERATDGQHPVKPWPAALFGLVPFYNLYWLFKWTGEIELLMNAVKKEERFDQNRPGLLMFGGYLLGIFVPGLSQIVGFAVLGHLTGRLKAILAAYPLPLSDCEPEPFAPRIGVLSAAAGSILLTVLLFSMMNSATAELKAAVVNLPAAAGKTQ